MVSPYGKNKALLAVQRQFAIGPLRRAASFLSGLERRAGAVTRVVRADGNEYAKLLEKYATLPSTSSRLPTKLFQKIASDLLGGIPLWRSPNLFYNVGAPVNRVSSALFTTASDLNVFNINDGLSGNAIVAEHAVIRILAGMAEVKPDNACGFFTFGGTATNLYAVKLAIAKCFPRSREEGIASKNIAVALTEDAHFSHLNVLNWLGIGTANAIIMKAGSDRTTDLRDAESRLRQAIEERKTVPAIIINGGTTYDHAIDDIAAFADLRDKLVNEYQLSYRPHIHVDSVIGWSWLAFASYDFEANPLVLDATLLEGIRSQLEKIKGVRLADSWGVDFHKGIGACPVPSSVVMINDRFAASFLSSSGAEHKHQTAREFSAFSPVDYTLETSRPGAAPLSALGSLHSVGSVGLQAHLANLVGANHLFRERIVASGRHDVQVLNGSSDGFVTMLRVLPRGRAHANTLGHEREYLDESIEETRAVSFYTKDLFAYIETCRKEGRLHAELSFSGKYVRTSAGGKVAAMKFYPTSPFCDATAMGAVVDRLFELKDEFDSAVPRDKI